MTERASRYGTLGCLMGKGLTSNVREVNVEYKICPCYACANGAVLPIV